MSARKPSMADIAHALGISKNAVSLALAGSPGVSEQTRAAVHQMARQLGYRRKPRRQRSLRGVALVFNESLLQPPATIFFGPVIQNLQKELARRECILTVFGVSDADERAMRLPAWPPGNIEVILVLSRFSPEFVRALKARAPVVWMDHYDATVACDKVVTENRHGAFLGVRHLIDAGHTTIGFMGDLQHSPSYAERWEGYRLALESCGLHPSWQWTEANPDLIALFWDGLSDYPSAWFCVNDLLALDLLHLAQERGLRVPNDVAIVGFDDLEPAQATAPAITTVHVDVEYYASRAVEVLANRLDQPDRPSETIRIAPILVIRESSRLGRQEKDELGNHT